jgi:hypothetical protein
MSRWEPARPVYLERVLIGAAETREEAWRCLAEYADRMLPSEVATFCPRVHYLLEFMGWQRPPAQAGELLEDHPAMLVETSMILGELIRFVWRRYPPGSTAALPGPLRSPYG